MLSRKLADHESEALSLANLGIALSDLKQWEDAQSAFRQARDIARTVGQSSTAASAIGGLAGVAFAQRRFKTASKLYAKAVRLSPPNESSRQFLEDLAGLIESLAAAGTGNKIQQEVQQLIDVAQQNHETEFASEALVRTARWFLNRNELENAVSLYAAGIAIAGIGPEDDLINRLTKTCLLMAFHVQMDDRSQEKFYEQVISQLNSNYEGIGKYLRNMIGLARQEAAQFDNIQK